MINLRALVWYVCGWWQFVLEVNNLYDRLFDLGFSHSLSSDFWMHKWSLILNYPLEFQGSDHKYLSKKGKMIKVGLVFQRIWSWCKLQEFFFLTKLKLDQAPRSVLQVWPINPNLNVNMTKKWLLSKALI